MKNLPGPEDPPPPNNNLVCKMRLKRACYFYIYAVFLPNEHDGNIFYPKNVHLIPKSPLNTKI